MVNQIVNDPDKIASMAALYSVNQKIGDVSKLPDSAVDVVTAIAKQNSNLDSGYFKIKVKTTTIVLIIEEFTFTNGVATKTLQSILETFLHMLAVYVKQKLKIAVFTILQQ